MKRYVRQFHLSHDVQTNTEVFNPMSINMKAMSFTLDLMLFVRVDLSFDQVF